MASERERAARLDLERLEVREVPSVTSVGSGSAVAVVTNNTATTVTIEPYGSGVKIIEGGTGRSWTRYGVTSLKVTGGSAGDTFVNNVFSLPVRFIGNGGSDYLEGYNGADTLLGGSGDDTLVGYGGNDHLNGGDGADVLRGMDGDDTLVAIDGIVGDTTDVGTGRDTAWVDSNWSFYGWWFNDPVSGAGADDLVQYVRGFANGADRTLNGDRIADPALKSGSGASYRAITTSPLFGTSGPVLNDIRQGAIGDCWLLAGLGAVAADNAWAIRQNVVDFNDGTYGVRLGNNYYRVDNDLPVRTGTTSMAYAGYGAQNSIWVAVVEKAYAHYRTGANTYASIEGGWGVEVNQAFRAASTGNQAFTGYSSATALGEEISRLWLNYEAVTLGFTGVATGVPLVNNHMYTVYSVNYNSSGGVASITLRNPWGTDGGGNNDGSNDGYVTVTPAQIYSCVGRVNWGRV